MPNTKHEMVSDIVVKTFVLQGDNSSSSCSLLTLRDLLSLSFVVVADAAAAAAAVVVPKTGLSFPGFSVNAI